ncbi:hypothetical protein HK101_001328 [Irineochytrium annulatum]|nr:hypothetical protein HK101_001328 [Irineochytrium annulatum]
MAVGPPPDAGSPGCRAATPAVASAIPSSQDLDAQAKAAILIALLDVNALWELNPHDVRVSEHLFRRGQLVLAAKGRGGGSSVAPAPVAAPLMHHEPPPEIKEVEPKAVRVLIGIRDDEDSGKGIGVVALAGQEMKRVPGAPVFSTPLADLLAGAVAGAVSRTSVAPLERLKILQQTRHIQGTGGLLRAFGAMLRADGVLGMFRGNGINVLRIAPYSAVQFSTYEIFKRELRTYQLGLDPTSTELTTPLRLLSGAMAGMCSVTATYPLDLLRTRLAIPPAGSTTSTTTAAAPALDVPHLRPTRTRGLMATAAHVVRDEGGLMALYRGLSASLVGVIPYMAINMALYESLRAESRRRWPHLETLTPNPSSTSQDPQPALSSASPGHILHLNLVRGGCGAMAGGVAQTATYPIEVIRRRMQVVGMVGATRTVGMGALVGIVWREEGVRGFYRGLTANLVKVVPAAAVSFMTYEWCKGFLKGSFVL